MRPPRPIQELLHRIGPATHELTQSLGRSPRPTEVAARLEIDVDTVIEALACSGAFTPSSLDAPASEEGTMSVADRLGGEDPDIARAEARVMLAPAVRRLGSRDRRIIELRYLEEWSQERIGHELGISQVKFSYAGVGGA